MNSATLASLSSALLLLLPPLAGCGDDGAGPAAPDVDAGPPGADAGGPEPDAGNPLPDGAVQTTSLDGCLERGGVLADVDLIDNNVVTAHGDVTTVALSGLGQIAIASSDGAIKLWTVEAVPSGELGTDNDIGYDTAFDAGSPIVRALSYSEDGRSLAAGDDAGDVVLWDVTPDVFEDVARTSAGEQPVTAVAVSPDGAAVAFADSSPGGAMRLWTPSTGAVSEVLDTALSRVAALAWLPDGRLVSAGDADGVPSIELRAAGDPAAVEVRWSGADGGLRGTVRSLSIHEGALVGAGEGVLVSLDARGAAIGARSDVDLRSVATTPGGAFHVATTPGGDLRTFAAPDLTDGPSARVPRAVSIRVHAEGDQLVVTDEGGIAHLTRCF